MSGRSRARYFLWASAAGLAMGQAHLTHGGFAWLAALLLGFAVETLPADGWRRAMAAVGGLSGFWLGLMGWGFAHHSWVLFGAQLVYLTASGALFGALAGAWTGRAPASSLALALAWTAVEALHELGPFGFPLSLGATQAHLPLRGGLAVVGSAVMGGLVVGAGHAAARALAGRRTAAPLVWVVALVGLVALGGWQPGLEPSGRPRSVAVVQGGIPTWVYTASNTSVVVQALVMGRYHRLTAEALRATPDLVLVGESALHRPVAIEDGEANVRLFQPAHGVQAMREASSGHGLESWVVTGAYRELVEGDRLVTHNSALLLRADNPYGVVAWADKRLMAPLAESHLSAGERLEPGVFDLTGWKLGVLICFESMYSRLARTTAKDSDVLAVLTNDAGFRRSGIGFAHAVQGWARAVETGRPLLRAAQSGISLAVDHRGEPLGEMGTEATGILRVQVQPMQGWTWFSRYGWGLGPLALALALASATPLAPWRRGRSQTARASTTSHETAKAT